MIVNFVMTFTGVADMIDRFVFSQICGLLDHALKPFKNVQYCFDKYTKPTLTEQNDRANPELNAQNVSPIGTGTCKPDNREDRVNTAHDTVKL